MKHFKYVLLMSILATLMACSKSEVAEKPGLSSSPSLQSSQKEHPSGPLASRAPALNATPLGLEIGYANLAGVKQKIAGLTKLEEVGKSEYSGGIILASDGQGLGVDGISKFIAIFDKNETLVAVVMTLPKQIKATYSKLAEKYKPVSNNIDEFMGNGSAKLEKGDSWVIVEAPHLLFTMDVAYTTKEYMASVERNSAEAQAKKDKEQQDKL